MNRALLAIAVFIVLQSTTSGSANAQIKGNPVFGGVSAQPGVQKSSSLLSPDLKQLYTNYATPKTKTTEALKKPAPVSGTFTGFLQIKGNKVVVDITAKDDVASAKAELQQMGATVTATYGRVISAIIPISALSQLESSSSIRFARPAYKPKHVGSNFAPQIGSSGAPQIGSSGAPQIGSSGAPQIGANLAGQIQKRPPVITQGDTAQLSYLARKKYKVDGKGVKVGVMSDSYNDLGGAATGVATGELPGPANPFGYRTPVQVLEDLDSGGTDEGRAMMEIVHGVAPGSSLAFHTADNGQADFANGILQLAKNGCSVIADDLFYYAEPFFQDGIIAQAVDQAKDQGVAYFSAAGNESDAAYTSVYRPTTVEPLGPGNGTAHDFSGPGDPPRYFQPVYIPQGGVLISSFQWDESSFSASGVGCQTDMDIYLLDASGNVVAAGNSDNLLSGDPIEVFGYQNMTSSVTFYLAIVKFAGPDPGHLKYILYNDAEFYLTNPAIPGILTPTLVGHAKADGAIAVGAAFYQQTPPYGVNPPALEGFSSEGGVPNYYDIHGNRIAPLIRKRPDIVAPDGVNTSFFGSWSFPPNVDPWPQFFGTSAATPHAAAAAALMIQAQRLKTITPSQIRGILSAHTWNMIDPFDSTAGKKYNFGTGYGLIKVDDAVGEVDFPNSYIKDLQLKPLCSSNPATIRNWEIINPNPFDVPITWFVPGSDQHGSLTVSPGDTTITTAPLYARNTRLPELLLLSWDDNFGFPRIDLAYSSSAVCGKDEVSAINSDQMLSGQGSLTDGTKQPSVAEVYPNPSSGIFRLYLSTPGSEPVTLGLYSVDGRQLQVRQTAGSGVIDIDATGYRPGVYFLKVIQGGEVKTIKLVKL